MVTATNPHNLHNMFDYIRNDICLYLDSVKIKVKSETEVVFSEILWTCGYLSMKRRRSEVGKVFKAYRTTVDYSSSLRRKCTDLF